MPPKINWPEVYEALPGKMENCLGAKCPQACCREKMIETHPCGYRPYFTTLCDSEKRYLEREPFPTLEMLGVKLSTETAVFVTRVQTIFEDIHLVRNRRRPNGKCKFEEIIDNPGPPLACRTQPFSHNAKRPIMAPECPRIIEIAGEEDVIKRILRVRELMGLTNNEEWVKNLQAELEKIRANSASKITSAPQ